MGRLKPAMRLSGNDTGLMLMDSPCTGCEFDVLPDISPIAKGVTFDSSIVTDDTISSSRSACK